MHRYTATCLLIHGICIHLRRTTRCKQLSIYILVYELTSILLLFLVGLILLPTFFIIDLVVVLVVPS